MMIAPGCITDKIISGTAIPWEFPWVTVKSLIQDGFPPETWQVVPTHCCPDGHPQVKVVPQLVYEPQYPDGHTAVQGEAVLVFVADALATAGEVLLVRDAEFVILADRVADALATAVEALLVRDAEFEILADRVADFEIVADLLPLELAEAPDEAVRVFVTEIVDDLLMDAELDLDAVAVVVLDGDAGSVLGEGDLLMLGERVRVAEGLAVEEAVFVAVPVFVGVTEVPPDA